MRERTIHVTYADKAHATQVLEQSKHDIEIQPQQPSSSESRSTETKSTRNRIQVEVQPAKQSLKESIEMRMRNTFKTNPLEHMRINKSMLRGFEGFQGELTKYWNSVGVQNNAETLRRLVQDKTRNGRDKGRERRSLQAKAIHDTPPTVTDPGLLSGDFQSLLDTDLIDDNVPSAARPESIKSPNNETLKSTESTIEGLLAKMGSDLELASLTDRLTKSADTLVSLQRQFASTKQELISRNASKDESPIQHHSQSLPTDSEPENMVPAAASQITPSSSSPPSSSLSDSLSTTLPENTNETISPETVLEPIPNTTSSEISAEAARNKVANESPAIHINDERTSSAPNPTEPSPSSLSDSLSTTLPENTNETISPEAVLETVPNTTSSEISAEAVTNNVASESPAKPTTDEKTSSAPNRNTNETISPETAPETVPNTTSSEISAEAVTNNIVNESLAKPTTDERTSSAPNRTEPSSNPPRE